MTTKAEWNAALDSWVAEERDRLGGPPSPEEVVAYLSGELSGDAGARVRALLVYYPELTPLLDGRIEPRPRRRPFALQAYAAAATFVIGALLFVRDDRDPIVATSHHELTPFRARGPAAVYELPAGEPQYLVTIVPSSPPAGAYDIEIARGGKVVWRARDVRAVDGTFVLTIPGAFLDDGTYTLNVRSGGGRLVDQYRFRITPRR